MKKLVLAGISVVVLAASVVGYNMATIDTPTPATKHVNSAIPTDNTAESTTQVTEPVTEASTQATTQTVAPAQPEKSIEEQNKEKIMALITEKANSLPNKRENTVWVQTFCFDRLFTQLNIYNDYNAMINDTYTKAYLYGSDDNFLYFTDIRCSIGNYNTNN